MASYLTTIAANFKLYCSVCGTEAEKLIKYRGMKLCPECREAARDYFKCRS